MSDHDLDNSIISIHNSNVSEDEQQRQMQQQQRLSEEELLNAGAEHDYRHAAAYIESMGRTYRNEEEQNDVLMNAMERAEIVEDNVEVHDRGKLMHYAAKKRNIEEWLTGDVTSSDSSEMAEVKKTVAYCTQRLAMDLQMTGDAEDVIQQLTLLEEAYLDAIAACRYYCEHKNPYFKKGIDRKQAVADALSTFTTEMSCIPTLKEKALKGQLAEMADVSFIDLVNEEVKQALAWKESKRLDEEEKQREKERNPLEVLEFEDFVNLITTDATDAVEFRDKKLHVLKGETLKNQTDLVSADNKLMVEKFIETAMEHISNLQKWGEYKNEKQLEATRRYLYRNLGVDAFANFTGAISMEKFQRTIDIVQHLGSDVDYALRDESQVTDVERSMAGIVDNCLMAPGKDAYASNETINTLQAMMEEAKTAGIQLPKLLNEDLKKLSAAKIYELRDDTFQNLLQICTSVKIFNAGTEIDAEKLQNDQKTLRCIMALNMSRILAVTPEWKQTAEYQLQRFIEQTVFTYCKEQERKQNGGDQGAGEEQSKITKLSEVFAFTRNDELSGGGSVGLRELAMASLGKYGKKDRAKLSDRVLRGMDNLSEICDLLKTFEDFKDKAFTEGLSVDDKQKFEALADQIQTIVNQADIMEDMRFVASELSATRFGIGFKNLEQTVVKMPDVFVNSARFINYNASKTLSIYQQDAFRNREKNRLNREIEKPVKMSEVDALLDKFSGAEKNAVAILIRRENPVNLIKEVGDANASDVAILYHALRMLQMGDAWADVYVFGVKMKLTLRDSGDVEVKLGGQKIAIPYNVDFLMKSIEQNVSKHADQYGDDVTGSVLGDVFEKAEAGDAAIDESRDIYVNVLSKKTGLTAAAFSNVATSVLANYAKASLNGVPVDAQMVTEFLLEPLQEQDHTIHNEREMLELMQYFENQKLQQNRQEKVVIKQSVQKEAMPEEQWSDEEAGVIALISDMISGKDTWKSDLEALGSNKRVKRMLSDHIDTLTAMIRNQGILEETFEKLMLPYATEESRVFANALGEVKNTLHSMMSMLLLTAEISELSDADLITYLRAVLGDSSEEALRDNQEFMDVLAKLYQIDAKNADDQNKFNDELISGLMSVREIYELEDQRFEQQAGKFVDGLQEQIKESVNDLFGFNEKAVPKNQLTLKDMVERNAKGEKGQGQFYRLVLQDYFKEASTLDKRAMVASVIRYAKPMKIEDGKMPTEEEIKRHKGAFLGAFLKGAGPLMHKLLQGLPTDGMDEQLKSAIKDTKSNLSPIPEDIVKARLEQTVNRSRGMITRIDVEKSLGAASIGQAFLCKIYGPNYDEAGKEVVIKMLRPDAHNHLEREKKFMLDCAKKTGDGMLKTYEGQLSVIEKELDLRIEAQNVEEGKIYNDPILHTQSMKLVDIVEPDANTMILEKAEGETVDQYLSKKHEEFNALMRQYNNEKQLDGGYVILHKLSELRNELLQRQGYVAELAKKWFTEGAYESGFFHGDLHAGNIMVSANGATAIDFGNATKIDKTQQLSVLHMICAAQARNVDGFKEHFCLLLSDQSKELLSHNETRAAFDEMLNEIFFKNGDPGLRIAVALSEAQKLGLELPAALQTFSNSQVRISNTINEMNTLAADLKARMADIFNRSLKQNEKNTLDPFAHIKEQLKGNLKDRAEHKKGIMPLNEFVLHAINDGPAAGAQNGNGAGETLSFSQKLGQALLSSDPAVIAQCDAFMQNITADEENARIDFGMQAAYNRIREKQAKGEEVLQEDVAGFLNAYDHVAVIRATNLEKIRAELFKEDPKDFFDKAEEVIRDRMWDTCWNKLGAIGVWRYIIKPNSRPNEKERVRRNDAARDLLADPSDFKELIMGLTRVSTSIFQGYEQSVKDHKPQSFTQVLNVVKMTLDENIPNGLPEDMANRDELILEYNQFKTDNDVAHLKAIAQTVISYYQRKLDDVILTGDDDAFFMDNPYDLGDTIMDCLKQYENLT